MKIGDKIRYIPIQIPEDTITEGIIKNFEPRGEIFNQDMLTVDEVEHWIPARECEIIAN